jgi:hypothetical protein
VVGKGILSNLNVKPGKLLLPETNGMLKQFHDLMKSLTIVPGAKHYVSVN